MVPQQYLKISLGFVGLYHCLRIQIAADILSAWSWSHLIYFFFSVDNKLKLVICRDTHKFFLLICPLTWILYIYIYIYIYIYNIYIYIYPPCTHTCIYYIYLACIYTIFSHLIYNMQFTFKFLSSKDNV